VPDVTTYKSGRHKGETRHKRSAAAVRSIVVATTTSCQGLPTSTETPTANVPTLHLTPDNITVPPSIPSGIQSVLVMTVLRLVRTIFELLEAPDKALMWNALIDRYSKPIRFPTICYSGTIVTTIEKERCTCCGLPFGPANCLYLGVDPNATVLLCPNALSEEPKLIQVPYCLLEICVR
jgi:hypothetical protein